MPLQSLNVRSWGQGRRGPSACHCRLFAFVARKGNPGFGWVVGVPWPDGETEVVKGFATEQQAAEWIAEHSEGWQGRTK